MAVEIAKGGHGVRGVLGDRVPGPLAARLIPWLIVGKKRAAIGGVSVVRKRPGPFVIVHAPGMGLHLGDHLGLVGRAEMADMRFKRRILALARARHARMAQRVRFKRLRRFAAPMERATKIKKQPHVRISGTPGLRFAEGVAAYARKARKGLSP